MYKFALLIPQVDIIHKVVSTAYSLVTRRWNSNRAITRIYDIKPRIRSYFDDYTFLAWKWTTSFPNIKDSEVASNWWQDHSCLCSVWYRWRCVCSDSLESEQQLLGQREEILHHTAVYPSKRGTRGLLAHVKSHFKITRITLVKYICR